MNPKSILRYTALLALTWGASALAVDGKWNADAGDNWSTSSRWTNSQIATGAGSLANFSFNITAARTVTVNANRTIGKLRFEDATTASHDWTLGVSGGSVLTLSGTAVPTIDVVNRTATFNVPLGGTQGFAKLGVGTLVLSASNTLSGTITNDSGGELRLNNAGALGGSTAVVVTASANGTGALRGSKLGLNGFGVGSGVTVTMLSESSSTTDLRSTIYTTTGSNWVDGPIELRGNGLCQLNCNNSAHTLVLNGNVTGNGLTGTMFVRGTGPLIINSPTINLGSGRFSKTDGNVVTLNTSGHTWAIGTIANGTVKLGINNALPTDKPLVLGQNGANSPILDLAGYNQTVRSLGVDPVQTNPQNALVGNSSTTSDSILTISGPVTTNFVGTLVDSVAGGTAKLGLTIAGGASVTLTSTNTYSGPTTVADSGSKLFVTTLQTGGGSYNLADGTTLGVTVGTSGSSLAMQNYTLGAGGALTNEFNLGAGNPTVPVVQTAVLAPSGTVYVDVKGLGLSVGQIPLIKYTSLVGTLSDTTFVSNSLPTGVIGYLSNNVANSSIDLVVTQAPLLLWTGYTLDDLLNPVQRSEWDISTTTNWAELFPVFAAGVSYQDGMTVQFDDSAATNVIVLMTNVAPGGITISNSVKDFSLDSAGYAVLGSGRLLKDGTAALRLSGTNTYAGDTVVKSGSLLLAGNEVIPDGAGKGSVLLNGTLDLAGYNESVNGLSGSGLITNSGGAMTLTIGNNTGSGVFTGDIRNKDPLSLVKAGNGSVSLLGNNNFAGNLTVSAGQLILNGPATPAGSLSLGGVLSTLSTITNTGAITLTAASTLDVASGTTLHLGGAYSGAFSLIKAGTGTLVLPNSGTIGSLWPQAGTLYLDNANMINSGYVSIGRLAGDNATVYAQNNATWSVNADFNIGDTADSIGTLYVRDNARIELKNLFLGKNLTCQGFVYQSGGIVTNAFAASSDWRIAGNGTAASNSVGKYFLSGGRLDLSANLQVGAYGNGEMTVSGGQVNMWTGYPVVGRFGGSTGRLIISGGEFNQLSTAQYTIIGEAGTGFLVVSNLGSLTCTNPLYIGSSNGAVGIGTAYLGSGGTITAPRIAKLNANGVGTLNLDGGTIRANASSPAYIQWLDAANVLDGGVTLDSAGYDAYVPQALLGTGNGGVTKVGTGSFSLLGTNTYKGANIVNGGKLALSTVSAGGGSITVADGAVLGVTVAAAGTSLASSSVTLGGSTAVDLNFSAYGNPTVAPLYATNLVLNGAVTVNVTAGNIVPAAIKLITFENISGAGNFVVGTLPQGMTASPVLTTNGNTIEMTLVAVNPLVWSGNTDTNWDLVTTNWTVSSSPTKYMQPWIPGDNVRFDDTAVSTATNVGLAAAVSPASIVVDNSSYEYILSGTGKISGPVLLTKTGTGVLRVNTANDFTGLVNITNGMLIAGNAAALGVTNGPTVVAGTGTLNVNGLNLGLEPVIASGAGFDGKGAIVNSGAAQNNALNNVTLAGDAVFGGTNRWDVRINGSTRATLSSMGTPYKLTKVSPNQVSIVAADVDPALGDIDVKEGILSFEGASTSLGDTAKTITLFTDAALQLWGATNQIAKPIVMNGHTNANIINGSGTGTIIGPITLNTDSPVSAASSTTLILNGAIGETAPYKLTKKGAGTLVLGGTNTYSGGFVAAEGNTVVSNSFGFGTGAVTVAGTTAGRIQLTADVNVTNTFVSDVNPGLVGRGVLEAIGTNNATWSGPINLLAAPGAGGHLVTDAGATLTLAGPITSFNGTVLAQRSGNVVYAGGGSYTNMNLTGQAYLGAHDGMATMLNLAIGVSANAVLDLNGYNQTLAGLSKGGSAALVTNSSATMSTLTLGKDTDNSHTVPIAGNVAVVKVNVNTMTMNAVNTYTGPTTVSGGTLLLQAANSNTAPVTVQAAGTLGGNGSVMADVTVQTGGTLSAGAAGIGQFSTTGSVTLQAGSTNWSDVNPTLGTNDVVAAASVNYGGTLVVNNLGGALAAGNSFKLFAAGSYTGSFAAIVPETPGAGLVWDTSSLAVNGTLKVQVGIPTTPTNLTVAVSGSTMTLTWPSDYLGWTAQSNSVDVADPNFWYDIPGSSTTTSLNITIEPGTPKVFYRLRYQTP